MASVLVSGTPATVMPSTKQYYAERYNSDPLFREQEKQRSAAKVRANYEHYRQLWRQAYLRKKAAKQQQPRQCGSASVVKCRPIESYLVTCSPAAP